MCPCYNQTSRLLTAVVLHSSGGVLAWQPLTEPLGAPRPDAHSSDSQRTQQCQLAARHTVMGTCPLCVQHDGDSRMVLAAGNRAMVACLAMLHEVEQCLYCLLFARAAPGTAPQSLAAPRTPATRVLRVVSEYFHTARTQLCVHVGCCQRQAFALFQGPCGRFENQTIVQWCRIGLLRAEQHRCRGLVHLVWLDVASGVFISLCVRPLQQRKTRGAAQVVK